MSAWPLDADGLIALQQHLAAQTPHPWRPPSDPTIGGVWVCFSKGYEGSGRAGEPAWAAAVTMERRRIVSDSVVPGEAAASYESGLMALREGPVLEEAVRALAVPPDFLLVNGTGRDHPRRAGLALHLGAVLDLPTIGVTHRALAAAGPQPASERGATSPLVLEEQIVGVWLRTRRGARPVVVHEAWRIELEDAIGLVLSACRRARTPEPLRRARRLARLFRAGLAGQRGGSER